MVGINRRMRDTMDNLKEKSLVYIPCITTEPLSILEDSGRGHQKLYYYSEFFDEIYVLSYGPKKKETKGNIVHFRGNLLDYFRNFPSDKENVDYVMITDIFITGAIGITLGLINEIPIVLRIGGTWDYPRDDFKFFFSKVIRFFTVPFVLANSKNVVTNAKNLQRRYEKFNDNIEVVYNGVDTDLFYPNKRKEKLKEKIKVIFVGTLNKNKGIEILAEASLELKDDFNFTFVGDGPLKGKLQKEYSHINFTGKVEHETVSRLLRESDIMILPSFSEGFPNILLEGMSAGLAVIGTNVGGIPEMIDHERNGILINPGSKSEIKKSIRELKNPQMRNKLGENARATVLKNYSYQKQLEKLVKSLFEK